MTFSPKSYLAVQLAIGALIIIGATWLFGRIAEDVMTADRLTVIDTEVAAWLHARHTPLLVSTMRIISSLHSTVVISVMTSLVAVRVWRMKRWDWLLALVLTVPGGMLLNVALKIVFHRPRPVFNDPLLTLSSYSFPSGHTMAATSFYGVLSWLAIRGIKTWYWRVMAMSGAAFMVLLVAFSRIYLGAHYLSDVLGALCEGLAWLAICLTTVETMRRRRRSKQSGVKASK